MVLSLVLCHSYKFKVDDVVRAYEDKGAVADEDVKLVEEISSATEGPGMKCKQRRIIRKNYFPRCFQRAVTLKVDDIELSEEIWFYSDEDKYWIRKHNVTWFDEAAICSAAYLTKHESNPDWCSWEEEIVVDFGSFGKLGTSLELYLRRTRSDAFEVETALMEKYLEETKICP